MASPAFPAAAPPSRLARFLDSDLFANFKRSKLQADQLTKRAGIEKERLVKGRRSNEAQIAAQRARVEQSRALYELRRRQVDTLRVRAGIPGVLQELPVQVGRHVVKCF